MVDQDSLEMKGMMDFYRANAENINLPESVSENHYGLEGILEGFDENEVTAVMKMFPAESLERSRLTKIIAEPSLYFTPEGDVTRDVKQAISPTAFVPGHISYNGKDMNAQVELFQIPEHIDIDPYTAKAIYTQALIHEISHTISMLPMYGDDDYNLEFPDGRVITGKECMQMFKDLTEDKEPMSKYSAGYIEENEKVALDEELAETVSAYMLGVTYCDDEARMQDPFKDRPEVYSFISDYLHAKKI